MSETPVRPDDASERKRRSRRRVAGLSAEGALPEIHALPMFEPGGARPRLTEGQRHKLASIATKMQLPPRTIVYKQGQKADSVFINGGGVIVSFADLPSGKRHVAGFRFYADVFGLAENGEYVNTTRAVTPVTLYKILASTLKETLYQDVELEFHFLCKMVDELRQAQRKSIVVARRDARGRIAMFVDMLRRGLGESPTDDTIAIPMSRSDIAGFLNLTLETVSRTCRQLGEEGILAFSPRKVRIIDREQFEQLVTNG